MSNNYKELLRLHDDGKVTVREKTYDSMLDMAKEIFGTCKWSLEVDSDTTAWHKTSCNESFHTYSGTFKDINFKFCPYCGKEIEEVK